MGLTALNELFAAWVETVYHQRTHGETGQPPLQRFLTAGPPALPSPQLLREAFLRSATRRLTKTATVSLPWTSDICSLGGTLSLSRRLHVVGRFKNVARK